MKELKKGYRACFSDLKCARDQMAAIQSSIDHAKQQLVSQFEEWFDENFEDGTARGTTR